MRLIVHGGVAGTGSSSPAPSTQLRSRLGAQERALRGRYGPPQTNHKPYTPNPNPHRKAAGPGGALQLGAGPQLLQHAGHLGELRAHRRHVAASCSSKFTGGSSASIPVLGSSVCLKEHASATRWPIAAALMCGGFIGTAKLPASRQPTCHRNEEKHISSRRRVLPSRLPGRCSCCCCCC